MLEQVPKNRYLPGPISGVSHLMANTPPLLVSSHGTREGVPNKKRVRRQTEMEARAELREPRISKGLVAVVLVGVTLGLGVMAGTMAKNLSAPAPATKAHAIVQGNGGAAGLTLPGAAPQVV